MKATLALGMLVVGAVGQDVCCRATTASCLACSAGVSIAEYCAQYSFIPGCSKTPVVVPSSFPSFTGPAIPLYKKPVVLPAAVPCCRAMTAECLSCSQGRTRADICAEYPFLGDCIGQPEVVAPVAPVVPVVMPSNPAPTACCMALTAPCMACSAGRSVEEYCKIYPATVGCAPVHNCMTYEVWTPEKTAWCCANEQVGCPVIEKPQEPVPVVVQNGLYEAVIKLVPPEESERTPVVTPPTAIQPIVVPEPRSAPVAPSVWEPACGGLLSADSAVCCPASCGSCGGQGCGQRPGGAEACCRKTILRSKMLCSAKQAPCVMVGEGKGTDPMDVVTLGQRG